MSSPDITTADVTVPRGQTAQQRTTTIYRIAELMRRYRAAEVAGVWRVRNLETGDTLPATFADEGMAQAGARLAGACDIRALFDPPAGR